MNWFNDIRFWTILNVILSIHVLLEQYVWHPRRAKKYKAEMISEMMLQMEKEGHVIYVRDDKTVMKSSRDIEV